MAKNKKNSEENKVNFEMDKSAQSLIPLGIVQISEEFKDLPSELQTALSDLLPSNMEGVIPRLPQIKILHAGALSFRMPDEERVSSFEGIIIDHVPVNAFWIRSYGESGGGNRPDCSSLDGIKGHPKLGKEINCATCVHNQFGTAVNPDGTPGRGKACKNMKRVSILLDGHLIPFRLSVPPTSIGTVDDYMTGMTDLRRPVIGFITEFSLETGTNADGTEFSHLVMKPVSVAKPEQLQRAISVRNQFLGQIRGQEILAEEYVEEASPESEVQNDEGAPLPEEPPF